MIAEKIGKPAMFELLAEESTELAHASLKMARAIRGENPTPVTEAEALAHVVEEFTDVIQCAYVELHLPIDKRQIASKERRFEKRWGEQDG